MEFSPSKIKEVKLKKYNVEMTEDEMLRFYENKIMEDVIRKCRDVFYTTIDMKKYMNIDEIKKHEKRLFELFFRDERIGDIYINDQYIIELSIDKNYSTLLYSNYEVKNVSIEKEIIILENFLKYIKDIIYDEPKMNIRKLMCNYADKNSIDFWTPKESIISILKRDIRETGFTDKYVEENNELFLTYKNMEVLDELLGKKIENLKIQIQENEKEDEEEY